MPRSLRVKCELREIGVWTRPDSARIIDSNNIFDYMNGAGELYLAYGFDHLEVYEYTTADQQDGILVEVYVMKTSNDAFGLLSMDWGGERVSMPSFLAVIIPPSLSDQTLYGGGLLRIWADTIYARVMAYRETSESKEAVLSLGRKIAADRKLSAEPELLNIFAQAIHPDWRLQESNRVFRSHLVLNSLYYLSHQNISPGPINGSGNRTLRKRLDAGPPKAFKFFLEMCNSETSPKSAG